MACVCVCVYPHLSMKKYFGCVMVTGAYILVESTGVTKGRRENNSRNKVLEKIGQTSMLKLVVLGRNRDTGTFIPWG